MPVAVTALYAALLAFVYAALFAGVGRTRARVGISLDGGGNPDLIAAMRRQMNFVENVPLTLLLIGFAELDGSPKWWIHVLGVVLLVSRIVHPFGIDFTVMNKPARGVGAAGTGLAMLAAAITLLVQFLK